MLVHFKVKLRRLIARHFSWIVNIYVNFKINSRNYNKFPPIIILTPGKVGSSSVYNTIKSKFGNKYSIYHIHNLSAKRIIDASKLHLSSDKRFLPMHLIVSKVLHNKLKKYSGPLKIITLVREPYSRAISGFFQNIDFYKNSIENRDLSIDIKLAKSILLNHINSKNMSCYLEKWFEAEFLDQYEINCFGNPIDDYKIFKKNNVELLLIKMESLNKTFKKASKEFLKEETILINKNIGSDKYYSSQYNQLKNQIKVDKEDLNEVYKSKYVQTFYKNIFFDLTKKYEKRS